MKLRLLGTYGGSTVENFLTSFLVDDFLAIDAGCLTQTLHLNEQEGIRDVLISHTHMDHILSLPFLADNLFGTRDYPLRIWGSKETIQALKTNIFNEVIWPDFSKLPDKENPTISFHVIEAEKPFMIDHLEITAISVNHVVPTFGFLIESHKTNSSFLYTADTCNTVRVWDVANAQENLKAVIVDCSFPNEYEELALVSGHMTPEMLGRDLALLKRDCRILVYHLKPNFEDILNKELDALGIEGLETKIQGDVLNL